MKAAALLPDAAEAVPDRTVIEHAGQAITYAELAERATQVAGAMRDAGLRPGDAVAVMLPNVPEFAATVAGSLLLGTRLVPMNYLLQPREVRYVLADSSVRLLVTDRTLLPQVEPALARLDAPPQLVVVGGSIGSGSVGNHHDFASWTAAAPPHRDPELVADDAPLLTLYTSGTTGAPKGALITGANLLSQFAMTARAFPPSEGERSLCVLPLFHVFALNALLLQAFFQRTTVVLHSRFDTAETAHSLAHDRITLFAGVPTMYFYLLGHEGLDDLSFPHLRTCISGGAPLPVEVLHEFERRVGITIHEGYGLTETTVAVCVNHPGRERKPGTIGTPYEGVQMKIVDAAGRELPRGDVGEVVIQSPNVMKGYHGKPEATADALVDGWFHTGDLGVCDEDGYFSIVDRVKDMILVGGFNVYPREIEELLHEIPGVGEAAVLGVPDSARGERVRAVIAPKPGQRVTEQVVRAHLERELASYKLPREYVFTSELPKGPTGKVLKRVLRDQKIAKRPDATRSEHP